MIEPVVTGMDDPRQSGRTTMRALHLVQVILDNPGEWVSIEDHAPTIESDRNLFGLVVKLLGVLGVPMDFDRGRLIVKAQRSMNSYRYPTADEAIKLIQRAEYQAKLNHRRRDSSF